MSCSVVPTPTSVSVTSDQPNPIRPFGSTVTLTCTVVLAEYIEGLSVNTEWTGPNEFSENGMAQRIGSTTTYTSTAMVSSFGRDQSGDYTCTATVNSTSSFITNSASLSATSRIFVCKVARSIVTAMDEVTGIIILLFISLCLQIILTAATIVLTSDPFQLTSEIDSVEVTFSLTCNSTGGPVSSVVWTRDGLLLDNTGPLVLTDVSTASYTNVLQVNGRTPGQDAIFLPATVTGITLNLIEQDANLGQEISIRSESSSTSQLPSELIPATLTISSEDLLIPYLI